MGSPYLNSGETLVLTTNRVSVSAVPYNIMLTTERIFLIEEGSTLFEPRILPLTMLLSVRSGTTPSSDPVITLLFRTGGGTIEQQTVTLVFTQGKYENRQPERDDWVRNLIQLSISHDEAERPAEIQEVPKVTGGIGLRPMARHGIAPEKVRPLSNVRALQPVLFPVTVTPEEAATGGETPATATQEPAGDSGPVPATEPEGPAPGLTPGPGTLPFPPDQYPSLQVTEDQLPEKTAGVPAPVEEPVPSPVTVTPEEATTGGETPATATQEPAGDSGPVPATEPEGPAPGLTPGPGTLPFPPDQYPSLQVTEDQLPEKTAGVPAPVEGPVPSPVTVTPEEAATGGETPATATQEPAGDSGPVPATEPEGPAPGLTPGPGTLPFPPDQYPSLQVTEDQLPEKTAGVPAPVEEPVPSPVTVTPEEAATGGETPATATQEPAGDSGPVPATEPEGPVSGPAPGRGTIPTPPARVIIPQIIEELLPVKTAGSPAPVEEPVPSADFDHEALLRAISRAVRSMKATEENAPRLEGSPECGPVPEAAQHMANLPLHGIVPVPEAGHPLPAAAGRDEVPDIIRALYTGARETDAPEPAASPAADVPEPGPVAETDAPEPAASPAADVPEPGPVAETDAPEPAASPAADVPETGPVAETDAPEPAAVKKPVPEPAIPQVAIYPPSESHKTLTIPQNVMQESAIHQAPEAVFRREPAAAKTAPVRHPMPPAREIHPIRTTLIYATVLLVVIALVAGGAMLLQQRPLSADIPAGSSPGIAPSATLLPEAVQPAGLSPAVTAVTTPVPFLPASPVPQTGVWVRVNSSVYYFGTVGNPELMKQISGTGDNLYKILRSDRPVQVSVQKTDNSGALLGVGIYRDGALISTRSVTMPMGSVDLLIDPLTARAPGLAENDTHAEHAAPPTGLENY